MQLDTLPRETENKAWGEVYAVLGKRPVSAVPDEREAFHFRIHHREYKNNDGEKQLFGEIQQDTETRHMPDKKKKHRINSLN